MTATALDLPTAVHRIDADGRLYELRYPDSSAMRAVVEGIFALVDYQRVDCLQGVPGAIVDIGGNIGATALLFHLMYPGVPVFAFEPSPRTYAYLHENVAPLDGVRAFNVGLFDRDVETRLYSGDVSVTSSVSASVFNRGAFEDVVLLRASRALDELGIDRVALLKIDTEGSEVPILRDLEDRLDRISAIAVEYHSERDRREIDALLAGRFAVHSAHASRPHLGTVVYVASDLLAERTDAERFAIPRPRL